MPAPSDDLIPLGRPPTDAEIQALLIAGRKDDAIRAYRLLYSVDLKTARDAIDARQRFLPLTRRDRWLLATLAAFSLGLVAYFLNQDHPWRTFWGILTGFAIGWKFVTDALNASAGPEAPASRASSSKEDG